MPPEVSVILPFFNAGKTLAAAIESIFQQTFQVPLMKREKILC
jgi:glycosyltransferase involved in cell wall biosynthesis